MRKVPISELLQTVVQPGYCSGCGICSANNAFEMVLDQNGQYQPQLLNDTALHEEIVCPFADHNLNEDDLAREQFDSPTSRFHPDFGFYKNIYAGYVIENDFRQKGSSGGSVSWLTAKLLSDKSVDYIVHVKENQQVSIRFGYDISDSIEDVKKGAKSKYYPVTLDKALQFIKQHEGRYAVVGIPCFIKGLQLLKKNDEIFAKRIKFTIGIFCGHLKTTHYLSSLISQFNVIENEVVKFNFRHKIPQRKASDYGTKLVLKDGSELIKLNKALFGTNWGWGLFKLKACDYCDDIIGETADISFGDAWIPAYEDDYLGTNIIVTRHEYLDKLIKEAMATDVLHYETLSPEALIQSQAGGFRHRREGLAYRLYLKEKNKEIVPKKRVQPIKIPSKKRRRLYKIRMQLQAKSLTSQNYMHPEKFKQEMMPLVKKLERIYEHSAWTKFRLKIKKWLKK